MNTKKIWRLKTLPSVNDVITLIENKLITKEEANEILFTEQTKESTESLESEIKFLREIVSKLSNGQTTKIIETIREAPIYYNQFEWFKPYQVWCSSTTAGYTTGGVTTLSSVSSTTNLTGLSGTMNGTANLTTCGFTSIKTF